MSEAQNLHESLSDAVSSFNLASGLSFDPHRLHFQVLLGSYNIYLFNMKIWQDLIGGMLGKP